MKNEDNESQILNKHSSLGKIPEYNVLLLGETGAGKSTSINAWANYLRYKTFDDACDGELEVMVPFKFKILDRVSDKLIEIKYGLNDDDGDAQNESFKDDYSNTRLPSAYAFKLKDKLLRIIDTPGIGDPRGVNGDRENIDNIFSFLNNYKELHAIVILLKANMSRITTDFCYCISELLNHLHKDATKNVIFCFTFSMNTLFRPGDAYYTVNQFFTDDLPEVELKLKFGENCFFIDNDSFRYLAAVKHDYPFDEKKMYRGILEIWEKSTEQSSKIWDRITREIEPHNLTDTISLNSTRKFILQMAESLVYLQNTFQSNIHRIKTKEKALQNDLCIIKNQTTDEVGKINFEKRTENDKDILKEMHCRNDVYKEEYEVIQDICSKFAYILVKYSITPINRFIEPYLKPISLKNYEKIRTKFIVNENYPTNMLNSLEKMKNLNHEIIKIINRAIKNGEQNVILLEDNNEYTEKLFKLEHTGEQLRQMFKVASCSKDKEIEQIPEKVLDLTYTNLTSTRRKPYSRNVNNNSKQTEYKHHTEMPAKNLNQIDILSIIQRLKVEFKEILNDENNQQASSPITNMIYHLENARNVILNSNSQATFGNVTMSEQTIQDNCTDDVKSLLTTINAMKDFCSKFSSTFDIVKIQETVVSLESVVASSTIYDTHNQTNFRSTADFSQSKISKEVASQNLIHLETVVEEPNSAKPVTEVKIYTKNVSEEKIGIETEGEELIVTETIHEDPIESETVPEKIENTETVSEEPIETETAPENPSDIEPIPEEPIDTETVYEKLIVTETVPEDPIESEIIPEIIENTETVFEEPIETETAPENPSDIEPIPEEPIITETVPENKENTETVHEDPIGTETAPENPCDIEPIPEESIQSETVSEIIENAKTVSKEPIDAKPVPEESLASLLIVGVIIVIAFAVGFNILRNKSSN